MDPRQLVTRIFHDAIASCNPMLAVQRSLEADPLAARKAVVIASGKAAAAMARGVAAVIEITDGIAVTTVHEPTPVPVLVAGHPKPNQQSLAAGRRALELAASAGPEATVIFLISGGSSALMAVPAGELTLDDLIATTGLLLASGADIAEINTVRKHLSAIKGGRLAAAAGNARLVTLVVADVPWNRPDVVGSGPTVADPSTFGNAVDVLQQYELMDRIPRRVAGHLTSGAAGAIDETPKRDNPDHEVRVVADGAIAAEAAVASARRLGLTAEVGTTALVGGAQRAAVQAVTAPRREVHLRVLAGETTVTVSGSGAGGRNQEAALAAALAIRDTATTFLAADTDGIDGVTDAAGAVVDSGTIGRGEAGGLDAVAFLENNDSHPYLLATGDLIVTGPTGTNVGDLWLVYNPQS